MGILTDYFAATPQQASSAIMDGPGEEVAPARFKFLEPAVLLGRLWAAMRHRDLAAWTDELSTEVGRVDDNPDIEGPWLVKLRDDFVTELAALADEQVTMAAKVWAEAEEWVGPTSPAAAEEIVRQLRDVARHAASPDQAMYCWICL